ncbi:hypothetical protein KR032_005552, partial [Drosophila birchii]
MSRHFCGKRSEAAVVRVMNYTLAEGHDDEVPVIRRLKECPTARPSFPSDRHSARPSGRLSACQFVKLAA